jgi:putative tricarboxylic transport membrane protein
MMMGVGVILGMVGQDLAYGMDRFTFGSEQLLNGLDFVPVAMGLFGISEVLMNLEIPEVREVFKASLKGVFPSLADWRRSLAPMLRGGCLGACMGVLPGGGPIISTFASYAIEKRISKHPEQFGKGAIEGVVAPETANNAGSTSSFIPLMTLGIPTNAAVAMIFVAMMIHGIRPGPLLLQEHPDIFWGVIASMFVGNAILLALNLPLVGFWASLLKVPYKYLVLIIIIVCVIGSYSVNYSAFDVTTMVVFGVFGYLIRRLGFPVAPLVLALILSPKLERSFQQSMVMGIGNLMIFIRRPISAAFLLVLGLIMIKPVAQWLWAQRHRNRTRVGHA